MAHLWIQNLMKNIIPFLYVLHVSLSVSISMHITVISTFIRARTWYGRVEGC